MGSVSFRFWQLSFSVPVGLPEALRGMVESCSVNYVGFAMLMRPRGSPRGSRRLVLPDEIMRCLILMSPDLSTKGRSPRGSQKLLEAPRSS